MKELLALRGDITREKGRQREGIIRWLFKYRQYAITLIAQRKVCDEKDSIAIHRGWPTRLGHSWRPLGNGPVQLPARRVARCLTIFSAREIVTMVLHLDMPRISVACGTVTLKPPSGHEQLPKLSGSWRRRLNGPQLLFPPIPHHLAFVGY